MLLEESVSSHRMRAGISVVVLNSTSRVTLPELTLELAEGTRGKTKQPAYLRRYEVPSFYERSVYIGLES
jgi:hypothetical protein